MAVKVHLPSILSSLYSAQRVVEVEAGSVGEIALVLNQRFPGMGERLLEPDGSLRRYVNVFLEGEDGRWQADVGSEVKQGSQVWIVQNVAGG